jgi:hypothetical protein
VKLTRIAEHPGNWHVSFDEGTYDLRIDGKNRRDNGKGVRAITHAAFKVALLMFCRERGLAHPGFLVLDTPMLTYRDPLRSKEGALAADEQAIRNTSLKEFFFEHLSKIAGLGQFVVVENVDLPQGLERLAHMEVFTGVPAMGRAGLFPTSVQPARNVRAWAGQASDESLSDRIGHQYEYNWDCLRHLP